MSGRGRPMNDDRWSKHLPNELIEMFLKRLTLVDSIRFAAVCPSWKSVSSQWFRQARATRLPWLLKSTRFLDTETVNYSLYSPSEDTTYDLKFPSASRNSEIRCSGSIDGWLIMSEWTLGPWFGITSRMTSINYFLNPMTGDRVTLSPLTGIMPYSSTASSDPTTPDCIVAISEPYTLVFCRPSSHKSWLWEGQHYNNIRFVKFHEDGKLYVMDMRGPMEYQIHVLALVTDRLDKCECELDKDKYGKIIAYKEKTIIAGNPPADSIQVWYSTSSFTWSSNGDLFLAWIRVVPEEHDQLPEFPFIHVLKMDDTSGDCNPIWVNAANHVAQDQVLLLASAHSTFISKRKSFMSTIDDSFCALHSGKFFINYWNRGTRSKLACGVWVTPNIIK